MGARQGNITREKTIGEIGRRNTQFQAHGTVVGIFVWKSVGINTYTFLNRYVLPYIKLTIINRMNWTNKNSVTYICFKSS